MRVCPKTARVASAYKDPCGLGPRPEPYLRVESGSEVVATLPQGIVIVQQTGDIRYWHVQWVGQCVDIDVAPVQASGLSLAAYDYGGILCGGDNYMGRCHLAPSDWATVVAPTDVRLEGTRCADYLEALEIQLLPR